MCLSFCMWLCMPPAAELRVISTSWVFGHDVIALFPTGMLYIYSQSLFSSHGSLFSVHSYCLLVKQLAFLISLDLLLCDLCSHLTANKVSESTDLKVLTIQPT